MNVVHLMASPFIGGPERQVLGLARALRPECRTDLLSFGESGRARPFLEQARQDGFNAVELRQNFPSLRRAAAEVAWYLRRQGADILCTSGYKPDLVGWWAARQAAIPVVAIAHGWTGVTLKVRFYEMLDALVMRWHDAVVCVSEAMATRVRRAGVPRRKIVVIRNAVDTTPFDNPGPDCRADVERFFARPPARIVGAAGRLSPEKGFDVLVDAAALVCQAHPDIGFVVFGDGPLRQALTERIAQRGLAGRFILTGFRHDLERLLPGLDLAVLSSHTEGLPVAVLEAQAASVPVVATAVGGTPEVVVEGVTGYLVPPADPAALAGKIVHALAAGPRLREMGERAAQRIRDEFTFAAQAAQYQRLFARLAPEGCHVRA
jgi:glycosyltransferase involved in cell wall biosynthesis